MFGFGKKIEQDPKKALENAEKTINTGFTGAVTKAFMGKDFMNQMNQSIDMGKNAINNMEMAQNLAMTGMEAAAEVLSIEDTGALVNFNPVVRLKLKVEPVYGAGFETTGQSMVSKIAIPRVGDKIKIKYNPADPTQLVVV
jgi:hypothetical protein